VQYDRIRRSGVLGRESRAEKTAQEKGGEATRVGVDRSREAMEQKEAKHIKINGNTTNVV